MNEETVTVELNGALCQRIEAFLEEHPEYVNLEEFVTAAARIRREELWRIRREQLAAAGLPEGPAAEPQTRDEEYSHGTLEAAWGALDKPLTSEQKTRLLKDLALESRKLRASSQETIARGIQ